VSIILGAIVVIFVPGGMNAGLISEYGGKPSDAMILPPIAISFLRSLCLLVGACLASLIVRYREKMGLERDPGYKDFP
jgi:ABC-type polysaccharide/polyol phosphate export permease